MRQKGVYPYDCMDIFEKFNDPKLLTKKDFYSMLTNTGSQMSNTNMPKKYGLHLDYRIWVNIMTCI